MVVLLLFDSLLILLPLFAGVLRTCFHCIDSVEDELHFLIDCPFNDDMRDVKCFTRHSYAIEILFYMIELEKMIFLLNLVNMRPILASTLFDMFQRRKRTI